MAKSSSALKIMFFFINLSSRKIYRSLQMDLLSCIGCVCCAAFMCWHVLQLVDGCVLGRLKDKPECSLSIRHWQQGGPAVPPSLPASLMHSGMSFFTFPSVHSLLCIWLCMPDQSGCLLASPLTKVSPVAQTLEPWQQNNKSDGALIFKPFLAPTELHVQIIMAIDGQFLLFSSF